MILEPAASGFEVDFKNVMSAEASEDVTSRDDPSRF